MMILDLICGFLLVIAGRNIFWLCVGMVGFLIGMQCAPLLGYTDGGMALLVSLCLGVVGAALAVAFEWFMVVFGVGFLGGGYLLMNLFPLSVVQEPYAWAIFVVGGLVGMCLMVIIFDWTLIFISSTLGAILIVNVFHVSEGNRELLLAATVAIGILVQYLALKNKGQEEHA